MSAVIDTLTRYAELAMSLWSAESMERARQLKPYIDRRFIVRWSLGFFPTREQMRDAGLSDEELISVGLLVKKNEGEEYHPHFQNRIIIPFFEDDRVVYLTSRRITDVGPDGKKLSKRYKALSMCSPPNGVKRPDGYNLDLLKDLNSLADHGLWVVEGPLDAARCCTLGQPAIAFVGGALETNRGLIKRLQELNKTYISVFVALDGTPDVTAERRALAAGAIGPLSKICVLPDGKDPDDLTLEQIQGLKEQSQQAYLAWIDGLAEWRSKGIQNPHWSHDALKDHLVLWRKESSDQQRRLLDLEMSITLSMNREEYYDYIGENGKRRKKTPPENDDGAHADEPTPVDAVGGVEEETQVEISDSEFDHNNHRPIIRNFTTKRDQDEKGKWKTYKYAVPMPDVVSQMTVSLGGWPRAASGFLFVHEPSDTVNPVRVFEKPEQLFGFFHSKATLMWGEGLDHGFVTMISKKEYFETLPVEVQRYDGVELCPHEPLLPNYYYAYEPDPEYTADGSYFKKLLAFFDNVDTTSDRELVKAMFLTPMAGIPYDTRPAFAITAGTRNCGKSTLAEAVGELYGGYIDLRIKNRDTERDIFGRLLAPHNVTKRVARVDNVKGLCSSEELEAILTSPVINGHRFMKGDASRVNNLTFILTGNSLNLSSDIARRTFTIHLTAPQENDYWRDQLMAFIRTHRKKVFADIIAEMRKPKETIDYSIGTGGWANWAKLVLSHVRDPNSVLQATKERRVEVDEEVDEAAAILEAVEEAVDEWVNGSGSRYPKYDIKAQFKGKERDLVFIPSRDMATILHKCFPNLNFSATMATRWMRRHVDAKRMPRVQLIHTAKERGCLVLFDPPVPEPRAAPPSSLPYFS